MPVVFLENEEAFNVFPKIYNQLIFAGMGEPVGLNMIAVKAVFDMMGIKNQKNCLEKITHMFDYYFEKIKEQ